VQSRLLAAWTADISSSDRLERLNGGDTWGSRTLDMTRVGVFGHSLGGDAANSATTMRVQGRH
jgi:predicted dienelactone hydrolase